MQPAASGVAVADDPWASWSYGGGRYDITTTENFEHFMGRVKHGGKNGTDRVDLVSEHHHTSQPEAR